MHRGLFSRMSLARVRGPVSDFFFQAEDGIRDYKVTGVQTCALPISSSALTVTVWARDDSARVIPRPYGHREGAGGEPVGKEVDRSGRKRDGVEPVLEIGRASCRERV